LTEPAVSPRTKYRCRKKKTSKGRRTLILFDVVASFAIEGGFTIKGPAGGA